MEFIKDMTNYINLTLLLCCWLLSIERSGWSHHSDAVSD